MAIHNNGGCDALSQKDPYLSRKGGIKRFHIAGIAVWSCGKANYFSVPIFSSIDGVGLYVTFEQCFTDNMIMIIIMSFGVAVTLQMLPVITARFVHAAFERTEKHAFLMMSIFIFGFFIIYGGTTYLRFKYSDMYNHEVQSNQLENSVSDDELYTTSESDSSDNSKGKAVALVLSISTLITSLICFGIEYVGNDEIKKKIECLEIERIEIDEKISDTQAAISQMENALNEGVKRDLDLDEIAMDAAIEEIVARCDILKSLARLYLSEYLANPSATSKISQEMLVESGDSGEETYEAVSEDENVSNPNNNINTVDKVA